MAQCWQTGWKPVDGKVLSHNGVMKPAGWNKVHGIIYGPGAMKTGWFKVR